jgi:hypothetical protein
MRTKQAGRCGHDFRITINGQLLELNLEIMPADIAEASVECYPFLKDYARSDLVEGHVLFLEPPTASGLLVPDPKYIARAEWDHSEWCRVLGEAGPKGRRALRRKT